MNDTNPTGIPPAATGPLSRPSAQHEHAELAADSQAISAQGEELAARFLQAAGMEIISRNWRCKYGELDLIARDADVTAFVEVKTRSGSSFGTPAKAVTFDKQQRTRRLALVWLAEQDGPWRQIRFDVISVLLHRGHIPLIDHLKGVF